MCGTDCDAGRAQVLVRLQVKGCECFCLHYRLCSLAPASLIVQIIFCGPQLPFFKVFFSDFMPENGVMLKLSCKVAADLKDLGHLCS